jgi:hypothetical protein
MVAVFSFYSAFAANRVLYLKGMYKGARPKAVDWMAAVVTVLSSLLLFLMGFLRPELMHVGVVRVQRAPGPGKLPRTPFDRHLGNLKPRRRCSFTSPERRLAAHAQLNSRFAMQVPRLAINIPTGV